MVNSREFHGIPPHVYVCVRERGGWKAGREENEKSRWNGSEGKENEKSKWIWGTGA